MTTADSAARHPSPAGAFPPLPICWPRLSLKQREQRLTELSTWIAWLTERYQLDHRTVPTCWREHGELIEELSALATAWHTAHSNRNDGYTPLHWHTDFTHTRQRLLEWIAHSGCRPDQHRATRRPEASQRQSPRP